MPSEYGLLDLILRLGIFGGFISISIFAFQLFWARKNRKKESNERLRRVCNALYIDINNMGEWYKSEEYEQVKTRHYAGHYSQNIINTMPYTGIVNSGLVTYLREKTQQKLHEYYFYAALHNKRMYNMAQIYNYQASTAEYPNPGLEKKITLSVAWNLNELELTKYENEMKKLIPELKLLLDDEINNVN